MIKKAREEELTIEDMGGMDKDEIIQERTNRVEKIFNQQQNKNILLAVMLASKAQYIRSLVV